MNDNFCRLVGEHLIQEEIKEERATLAQRLIALLGVVCLLVLVSLATNALAEEIPVHVIDHHEGVKMRLMDAPCTDPTSLLMALQMSPAKFHGRWKAIQSTWKMKDGSWQDFPGCWMLIKADEVGAPDDVFFFTFSDGGYGQALKSEVLRQRPGA